MFWRLHRGRSRSARTRIMICAAGTPYGVFFLRRKARNLIDDEEAFATDEFEDILQGGDGMGWTY